MRILLVAALWLSGCEGYEGDEGGGWSGAGQGGGGEGDEADEGGGYNGGTTNNGGGNNGGTSGSCNTANESCAPGRCGGEGPSMLPGADCQACHRNGGGEAPPWTVGGTIFVDDLGSDGASGVTIRVTDSRGSVVTLNSNGVGNFYSGKSMVPPLTAEVETRNGTLQMGREVSTGACNACHSCDGEAGGKLYAP